MKKEKLYLAIVGNNIADSIKKGKNIYITGGKTREDAVINLAKKNNIHHIDKGAPICLIRISMFRSISVTEDIKEAKKRRKKNKKRKSSIKLDKPIMCNKKKTKKIIGKITESPNKPASKNPLTIEKNK